MPETSEQMKGMLSRREARYRVAGGEIFAGWGILNLIAMAVQLWVWQSVFVWLLMIAIGIPLQSLYIRHLIRQQGDEGFQSFWGQKMGELWVSFLILLTFLIYVFPFLLKLYPPELITVFVYFWLSLAMFYSSILTGQVSIRIGAAVFFLSGCIGALVGTNSPLPYALANILGLIVPGIWSKYEESR